MACKIKSDISNINPGIDPRIKTLGYSDVAFEIYLKISR